MTTHRAFTLAALVAFAPLGSATAQEVSLDFAGAYEVVAADEFFAVNEDDHAAYLDVSVGYEVYENLFVFGEYRYGGEQSTLFNDFDVDFQTHAARLGVKYAYPVLRWLHPYVRAGVGAHWGDLDLSAARETYDDTAFGLGAFVSGGFELVWYVGDPEAGGKVTFWDRLGFGVVNDYGYAFGPTHNLDEVRAESADGSGSIDLGELDLSGFTWRLGLTLRYQL